MYVSYMSRKCQYSHLINCYCYVDTVVRKITVNGLEYLTLVTCLTVLKINPQYIHRSKVSPMALRCHSV